MAGAGWRRFQPGEVLTATNLQSYGIDQSVQVYPDAGARGSAVGTAVSEGMVSYLMDINQVQVYNGSSYNAVGTILQVVNSTQTTSATTSSTTFQDTGLSASITPSSTSNKILILLSVNGTNKLAGNQFTSMDVNLVRNSTQILQPGSEMLYDNENDVMYGDGLSASFLDSPATTSSVTYKAQFRSTISGQAVRVQQASAASTITLMEVVG